MTQEELKMELEELAVRFSEGWHKGIKIDASDIMLLNKAAQALAQPEQEPVAWVSEAVCDGQYIDGRPRKIWWECKKGVGTAFYTTPPQRTWVGLTDEDMADITSLPIGTCSMMLKVEAKLKEKNT